jgi:hypothetical protein
MPRPADIQDQTFRTALEQADRAIDDGDYARAARTCADAYILLLEQRPELAPPPPPPAGTAGTGGFASYLRSPQPVWPRTGGIIIRTGEDKKPQLVFEKERFSFSEAAGYYEFLIGELWRLQQQTETTT